ncbi:MAG: hypothetical protein QE271_13745 [Bacteriovoracaceae bacterium]|nr:hypothetical protein [Bacteriovoracaceae bacterium]
MAKIGNFQSYIDLDDEEFHSRLEQDFPPKDKTWFEQLYEFNELLKSLSLDPKWDFSSKEKWMKRVSEFFLFHFSNKIDFSSQGNLSISNFFLSRLIDISMSEGNLELAKKLSSQLDAKNFHGHENILNPILPFLDVEQLYLLLTSQIKRNSVSQIKEIYQEFYTQCISRKMWNEKFRFLLEELRNLSKIYLLESNFKQAFLIDLLLLIDLCVSQYTKLQVPMFRRKKEFLFLFYYRNSYDFGLFTLLLYSKNAGNTEIFDSILNLIKEQKNKNYTLLSKDVFSSLLVVGLGSEKNGSLLKEFFPAKENQSDSDFDFDFDSDIDFELDPYPNNLAKGPSEKNNDNGGDQTRFPLAINFKPSNEEENKIYIETLKQFGKYKEAVKYIRANGLNKDFYWVLEEAELLFKLNKWEECLQLLEALNLNGQKIEFQNASNYLMGEVYQKQGQISLARGYYKKVFSNNPNYLLVKNKLDETK